MFRKSDRSADFGEPVPKAPRPAYGRWGAGVVLIAVVCAGTVVVLRHKPGETGPSAAVPAAATARIERRSLSTSQSIPGTVGFGKPRDLGGQGSGVVTWLPQPGSTIRQGHQLYRVDDRPVALFYGELPLYRDIAGKNLVGRDVEVIAANLTAMGYDIGYQPSPGAQVTEHLDEADPAPDDGDAGTTDKTADKTTEKTTDKGTTGGAKTDRGTASTTTRTVIVRSGEGVLTPSLKAAIRRWQEDQHLEETGTVRIGDVVVQAGPVRVDSVAVQPGADAGQALMSVSAIKKVISVEADADQVGAMHRGEKVSITLPDESKVKGRVSSIGSTVTSDDGDDTKKVTVTITPDRLKALSGIDSADVTVVFAGTTHKNVLAVPVEALVSLNEGGYAVQLPSGSLIAVTTDLFSGGMVEIQGDGLEDGESVVVAS